jgi:hypothetical protein
MAWDESGPRRHSVLSSETRTGRLVVSPLPMRLSCSAILNRGGTRPYTFDGSTRAQTRFARLERVETHVLTLDQFNAAELLNPVQPESRQLRRIIRTRQEGKLLKISAVDAGDAVLSD